MPMRFFSFARNGKPFTTLVFLGVSTAIVLSLAHHLVNFWGLGWGIQALVIFTLVPIVFLALSFLYSRTKEHLTVIEKRRWVFFLIPAILVVTILAWKLYSPPVVWHTLQIIPSETNPGLIQLVQIRAGGKVIKLSQLNADGWRLQDGTLTNHGQAATPIEADFQGPIGEPVQVLFLASPESNNVTIVLDRKSTALSLSGPQGDQRIALMTTQYKQGIPAGLISLIVVLTDLVTVSLALLLAWLMQEIPQLESQKVAREPQAASPSHRALLTILLLPSILFHLVSFLTVPLAIGPDSLSYLEGAIHWLQYGNLDGASPFRGPGMSVLVLPGMLLFGNSPWSVKVIFHLLAIGCVALAYRLGWQLSRQRWFAFLAGLIALLIPDLFLYSNFVMSEMPNVFFGLAYVTLLISALETLSFSWILAALFMGSISTLVRPENMLYLLMGIFFLLAYVIWRWLQTKNLGDLKTKLTQIGLSVLLAFLPIITWSFHNLNMHGFFGLTSYTGAALYDGWIYYGERSHIDIIAKDSPAVRLIHSYFPTQLEDPTQSPTSWDIYELMKKDGYTDLEIFAVQKQAAVDSVKKNNALAIKLFFIKIRKGFWPERITTDTFPLPTQSAVETYLNRAEKMGYFEPEENFSSPALITLQRAVFGLWDGWYIRFYRPVTWFCVAMALLALYRKPFFIWAPFVLLTLSRVFVPTILGMSHWRYIVSGIIPLLIFVPVAIQSLMQFIRFLFVSPAYTAISEESTLQPAGHD